MPDDDDDVVPSIPPRITASRAPSVETVALVMEVDVAIGKEESRTPIEGRRRFGRR